MIKSFLLATALLLTFASKSTATNDTVAMSYQYPFGDVRNCDVMHTGKPLVRMDALPGLGFDNLRNIDLNNVLDFNNYSRCQVSRDGLYLLPDSVFLIPIQESMVDVFAEYFDTFQDYTSQTAASVNLQFKYTSDFSISGKFSVGHRDTKSKMVNHQSNSARISLRYKLYNVQIPPDAQLHGTFKSRLFDIAANIQNGNPIFARYLSELIVRDYGTHVITSVDVGAGLSQTTFVAQDFLKNQQNRSLVVSASASAKFFGSFSVSANVKVSSSNSDVEEFDRKTTNSHVSTYGGPLYKVGNFSLTDWESGISDHLVTIDRLGIPLHSIINSNNVPELPESTLFTLVDYVYDAIRLYYKVNTVAGCMDPLNPNFNFQANVDDNSCNDVRMNYTFGGIYQTCTESNEDNNLCSGLIQVNPIADSDNMYSCPEGFSEIFLFSGTVSTTTSNQQCDEECIIFSCIQNCWNEEVEDTATYSAFWCMHRPDPESDNSTADVDGMMFGGVYTSKHQNLLTGSLSCPPYFYPLHFGENIMVCVSQDANGEPYSVPFGGFESCTNGNPLAATNLEYRQGPAAYPHRCGRGYSRFLATVASGCEINFCSDMNAIKKEQPHPPRLPPFHSFAHVHSNVTNTLVIKGLNGKVWYKSGKDGTWKQYTARKPTGKEFLDHLLNKTSPNTTPQATMHLMGTIYNMQN